MNKSLKQIFNNYPNVEKKFNGDDVPLTKIESVFYQLSLFVSEPDKYSFDINLFYEYLRDEDLLLGLRFILDFFQKDTYLIKNKRDAFINIGNIEGEKIYSQSTFAEYLEQKGLNYTKTKIGIYHRREKQRIKEGKKPNGIIPLADFEIDGTPYWYESTVDWFARELLKDEKNLKKSKTSKKNK